MSEVLSILDTCSPRTRPLRVLTFPTHERYQSTLDQVNAVFYLWQGPNIKNWETHYAPVPSNHVLLPPSSVGPALPPGVFPDLVLSQSLTQINAAISAATHFGVPVLRMEHTLPDPQATIMPPAGDFNAFITEEQRRLWHGQESDPIIRNAIDTDFFRPLEGGKRQSVCLSVVNDWIRRDAVCGYTYWRQATAGLPVKVLGDTPGLSKPARDTHELLSAYQSAQLFLCTATHSTSPVTVLEAMAAGCCVVAHRIRATEETITHNETGFLVDTPSQMGEMVRRLLANPQYCEVIGAAARRRIVERHGKQRFTEDWNRVLGLAAQAPWWRKLWSKSG